jgi:hypothetical protein
MLLIATCGSCDADLVLVRHFRLYRCYAIRLVIPVCAFSSSVRIAIVGLGHMPNNRFARVVTHDGWSVVPIILLPWVAGNLRVRRRLLLRIRLHTLLGCPMTRWAAIQALLAAVDCLRARAASIFQAADLGVFSASSGDFPAAFMNADKTRVHFSSRSSCTSAPPHPRRLLTIGEAFLQLLTVFGRPNRETPKRPESVCASDSSAASVRRTSDSSTKDNPGVGPLQ